LDPVFAWSEQDVKSYVLNSQSMTKEQKEYNQYLLLQYIHGTATIDQETSLFNALEEMPDMTEWELIVEELMAAQPEFTPYNREEWNTVLQAIIQQPVQKTGGKVKRMSRYMQKIAIAAVVLIALSVGLYYVFMNQAGSPKVVVQHSDSTHDVPAPAVNRATITLANGQRIYLDSTQHGTLATEGTVKISKVASGEVAYTSSDPLTTDNSPLTFNALYNPRGSRIITITLSDGTKVWLNNESSLRYPTVFAGKERRVEVTGEAYFEVSSLPLTPSGGGGTKGKMPFIVSINGKAEVEVLGTHFNIYAYADEEAIKTTLLEGRVKVSMTSDSRLPTIDSRLLTPGQQAIMSDHITVTDQISVDQIMAWKNNRFYFMSADIHTIIQQLERWYDVDIVLEGSITDRFTGIIARSTNVLQVFRMLQKTGSMKVNIQGRKILIST
jgi:transmembrane sensor